MWMILYILQNMVMSQHKKSFFIITGFLMLLFILWNYLLRIRLPREISIEVSASSFFYYIITFAVSVFGLVMTLFMLYNIKCVTVVDLSKYNLIHKSLSEFDNYVKKHFEFISNKLQEELFEFLFNNQVKIKYLNFLFSIVPKIIVSVCLIYDVFIMNTIVYFYKMLPLLIFTFFVRYIKYSFEKLYKHQLEQIGKCINISCYTIGNDIFAENITLDFYVNETVIIRYFDLKKPFDCLITINPDYVSNVMSGHNLVEYTFDYKKALIKFKNLTEHLIKLRTVCFIFENFNNYFEKYFNILLYAIMSICWGYAIFLCMPENIFGF